MKETEYCVSLQTSAVLTEKSHVMVISEESPNATEYLTV
jgi:hypothetical protein